MKEEGRGVIRRPFERMKKPDLPDQAHVHMIGVGGAGMSGLAIVMAGLGYKISGSDRQRVALSSKLEKCGVSVLEGHSPSNIDEADLVVSSAAIGTDNPELLAAREKGIPIISRAEMLGRLMGDNFGIAISGTHGKTTTTSMLALILEEAALDPTVLVGGEVDKLGGNAVLGESNVFLTEACEAFNSFLTLSPMIALVTNIDADHLDCHGSLEGVKDSFRNFLSRVREGGCAVMCGDCENTRDVIPSVREAVITYGFEDGADLQGYDVDVSTPAPTFKVRLHGRELGEFKLEVPGWHNVLNALGAIGVATEMEIDPSVIRAGLLNFTGAGRRFELLGEGQGIVVIDDYAHHPAEVAATLSAARSWGRRIVSVFQPHLYSRTKIFAADFADALLHADMAFVMEVYAAREAPMPGVSGAMIADRMNEITPGKAEFAPDRDQLVERILSVLHEGDMLLVMGAGDIRSIGEAVLDRLQVGNDYV